MLNQAICRKCVEESGNGAKWINTIDNVIWEAEDVFMLCPHDDNTSDEEAGVLVVSGRPPITCPYLLEQELLSKL